MMGKWVDERMCRWVEWEKEEGSREEEEGVLVLSVEF